MTAEALMGFVPELPRGRPEKTSSSFRQCPSALAHGPTSGASSGPARREQRHDAASGNQAEQVTTLLSGAASSPTQMELHDAASGNHVGQMTMLFPGAVWTNDDPCGPRPSPEHWPVWAEGL